MLDLGGQSQKMFFVDKKIVESKLELQNSQAGQELSRILLEFKEVCAKNEIKPLILYIPTATRIYAKYTTEQSGANWLSIRDKYLAASDNSEQVVAGISQRVGVEFLSLTPIFSAAAKKGRLIYHQLDSHWNSEGAELAAAHVVNILKSKGIAH
jgi:hypothetical protein